MSYFVIKCRYCNEYQSCIVKDIHKYTFHCRRCNQSTKLKKKNEFGLSLEYFAFKDANDAVRKCQELKFKRWENKNGRI